MTGEQDEAAEDLLVPVLDVERLEEDFYRGIATPRGKGRSFGGQVIAQALMSATHTVDPGRPNHSLHAYFMRPGNAAQPVLYRVDRDRDGGSFSTRRVVAIQNGKPILNMAASFHVEEEGWTHQDEMPDVPGPETLKNQVELGEELGDQLPERVSRFLSRNHPLEVRPVEGVLAFNAQPGRAGQDFWVRARHRLPDNPGLHRAALAYTSDLGLLGASVRPHGASFAAGDVQMASLDHALWLHGPFRMDEWLLYSTDSTWARGARGFSRGRVFTQDGRLIADVAQEGLIRPMRETPAG